MKNCFKKKSVNKNKLFFTNINCLRTSWKPIKEKKRKRKKQPLQNTTNLRIGQRLIRRIQWFNATKLEQENLHLLPKHIFITQPEKNHTKQEN
jgi:hypothetical protein